MVSKSIKKIWFIWLWLSCLILAWCFHIPDEDWLPSKNKPEAIHKDDQVEQAINSFVDWMNMVSSQRNEIKSTETPGISRDDEENIEEIEAINNEEVIDTEETIEDEVNENQEEKILDE